MTDLNLGDGLRKVFLAGIGALATTVEKSQEIVDELVKKGELTVEQGKALNTELKRKAQEVKVNSETEKSASTQETVDSEESSTQEQTYCVPLTDNKVGGTSVYLKQYKTPLS